MCRRTAQVTRCAVFRNLHDAHERWSQRFDPDVSTLHPGLVAWIYVFRALLAFQVGDFAKSLAYRLPMYDVANETGQLQRAIINACNSGGAFGNLNDHQTAFEWMKRGSSAARRTGWPICIGNSLMQTTGILRHLGRLDNAHDMLLQALELLGGRVDPPGRRLRQRRWIQVSPSNSSTSTRSPAATCPCASCSTIMQLASTIDLKIPEPCAPVTLTVGRPLEPVAKIPR